MIPELNKKYLITTDVWFVAPEGEQYRAVFGTVTSVNSDEDTLGIKTNKGSSNWYVVIGNMIIAGCQIHYAIQTDEVSFMPPTQEIEYEGSLVTEINHNTRIYNADIS